MYPVVLYDHPMTIIEMRSDEALMAEAPAEILVALRPTDYVLPRASLADLVVLGRALLHVALASPSALERQTRAQVGAGCEAAETVMLLNSSGKRAPIKRIRLGLVKEASAIKGALRKMASSGAPEVSAEASELLALLFSGDAGSIQKLSPRAAWQTVASLGDLLGKEGRRGRLDALVPRAMTRHLFELNDALGAAMGVTVRVERHERISLVKPAVLLRRRISRYVAALLASVADDDGPAIQRVTAALAPIRDLRADQRERHGRRRRRKKT